MSQFPFQDAPVPEGPSDSISCLRWSPAANIFACGSWDKSSWSKLRSRPVLSWMLHSVHVFLCAFIAKSYLPISEVSESTRSLHRTSLRVPCMQQAFSRMNATQKIETSALLKEWLTTMKHQCYAALSPKTASESSAEAATTRCNMQ